MDIKMQIYLVHNSQFINMKFYRLFSFSLEMWIGTGLHVYLCNMCLPGASRCQEKVLDALDLKLVVRHHMGSENQITLNVTTCSLNH